MPSGKSAPGTTWRPTEVATTPWVPNLKLPATKLSKNITTPRSALQAISVPTFFRRHLTYALRRSALRLPMSFLIGIRTPKHYPGAFHWLSLLRHLSCKLFHIQADVYCGGKP
jgi:hypothetical protein